MCKWTCVHYNTCDHVRYASRHWECANVHVLLNTFAHSRCSRCCHSKCSTNSPLKLFSFFYGFYVWALHIILQILHLQAFVFKLHCSLQARVQEEVQLG